MKSHCWNRAHIIDFPLDCCDYNLLYVAVIKVGKRMGPCTLKADKEKLTYAGLAHK